ncbi:patatin-like phospholipase family protein [Glaciecola siphonariae]|uniref:Patatin-like phospholipase family protein n=1 Tax=Glaciecola siphonariae TaxID=521012 RepID=A0ABV9LSS1_9ALTE
MEALSIYAGPKARETIEREGISADTFSAVLGASGGPKWFVLYGLDKVLFSEFMDKRTQPVDIIGSSIGAFRSACFTQQDTKAAIERLADKYSNTVYSERPSVQEITSKGVALLDYMMGDTGVDNVLNQQIKRLHIVVAKSRGLAAKERKWQQGTALGLAAARNAIGRSKLQKSFTRVVFSNTNTLLDFDEQIALQTEHVPLSASNTLMALMATGSIPMVIQGVPDIPGAGRGMYRDGGIIDYHFDIKLNTPGLVLYPHFAKTPIPGWFDKGLKRRQCHPSSYDNVVMLVPSDEFIASLPYQKIPDRKDFSKMSPEQRIPYWHKVMAESERLAQAFVEWVGSSNPSKNVQAIRLQR